MFVVQDYKGWYLSGESTSTNIIVTSEKSKAMLFATKEKAREAAEAATKSDPWAEAVGGYHVGEVRL